MTQKVVSLKDGKKAATAKVEILNAKGMKVGDADFAYSLNSAGAKVKVTFRPDTAVVKSMARLGLTFEMNDTYGNVAYLGRGDNETYSDRMQSGKIALYQTTAERMFHYYVTPQSTGNRTDVRWMKLTDETDRASLSIPTVLSSSVSSPLPMMYWKKPATSTTSNVTVMSPYIWMPNRPVWERQPAGRAYSRNIGFL